MCLYWFVLIHWLSDLSDLMIYLTHRIALNHIITDLSDLKKYQTIKSIKHLKTICDDLWLLLPNCQHINTIQNIQISKQVKWHRSTSHFWGPHWLWLAILSLGRNAINAAVHKASGYPRMEWMELWECWSIGSCNIVIIWN